MQVKLSFRQLRCNHRVKARAAASP